MEICTFLKCQHLPKNTDKAVPKLIDLTSLLNTHTRQSGVIEGLITLAYFRQRFSPRCQLLFPRSRINFEPQLLSSYSAQHKMDF